MQGFRSCFTPLSCHKITGAYRLMGLIAWDLGVGLLQLLICDNAGQKQVPDANQRKTHSPDDITGQGVKVYFIGQKQIKKTTTPN